MDVCQRPDGSFWSLNMRTAQVNFIFFHLILISSHFTRLKLLLFHPFTSVCKVANCWNLTNDVYFRKSSKRSTGITFTRQSCCLFPLIYVRLIFQCPWFNQLEHAKVTMNVSFKWCKERANKAPDHSAMPVRCTFTERIGTFTSNHFEHIDIVENSYFFLFFFRAKCILIAL